MKAREYTAIFTRILHRYGATDIRLVTGRKNNHLWFNYRGEVMRISYPLSPSDSRHGLKNGISQLLRMLGVKTGKRAFA